MLTCGVLGVLAGALLFGEPAEPGERGEPGFDRDIRPLLADRCFSCHGPDKASREAGLRLDRFEDAISPRRGGAAIVPGQPEQSALVRMIRAGEMPPPESGLALDEGERQVLVDWIAAGAPYEEHWYFGELNAAPPPDVERDDWPRDELDRYVLARLEREGLAPATESDRGRWLRRVAFDLTGLAPAPGEIDAFLGDEGPDAHARAVDRLLASPRHAERMASDWLDLARYADSYGYQADVHRNVWPWRDWVLRAYAENQPYDEFLTWQLAGDLLPEASREQRLATAFNRLHRQTNEGGSVEEEMRLEYVADRVNTFGTAFLGLTLECARCHDHKFDPIEQREYYGFAAFFANIDESGLYSHFTNAVPTPTLALPDAEQEARIDDLRAHLLELEARREDSQAPEAASSFDAGAPTPGCVGDYPMNAGDADTELGNDAPGEDRRPGRIHGDNDRCDGYRGGGVELTGDDPLTFPGVGHFRRWDAFSFGLRVRVAEPAERYVVLHRSKAWHDSGSRGYQLLLEESRPSFSLIHFWPGNALRVRAREPIATGEWVHLGATYDGSIRAAGVRLFVDGREVETEVVRDGLTRKIVGGAEGDLTIGERFRDRGFRGGRVDDLTVFDRVLAPLEIARLADEGVWQSFFARQSDWSDADRRQYGELLAARTVSSPELGAARRELAELVDAVPEIMVMEELSDPRETHVLARGRYDEPRERVAAGTPAALPPWPAEAARDRLGLARWLTGPAQALTARVAANRLWQIAFGRGLVATPEDFGTQGARPSHPVLLDYLAGELIASGWDQRALLRRIVLSSTYRQTSTVDAGSRARDPGGALLSRYPEHQLPAEAVRDSALLAAGLLVEHVGGPSVKPYQPAGLWREVSGKQYVADSGEGLYRRSLYTFWKRTSPPPSMLLFDAAKRDVCIARRQSTTTPLQALVLWNETGRVEAARRLAEKALRESEDARSRASYLFRALVGRAASERELALLVELAREERSHYASRPDDAAALLSVGAHARDEQLDTAELAAWSLVANTLMGHDAAVVQR